MMLPCGEDWDINCGALAASKDLQIDIWFHRSYTVTSLNLFPGTECYLSNGYDIVSQSERPRPSASEVKLEDNASERSPFHYNRTIRSLFGIDWIGNIVVLKRGRRDRSSVVNITRREISLINALVNR